MARKYSIVKQSAPNQHSVILCNKISLHDWAKCLVRFGVVSWERAIDDDPKMLQKSNVINGRIVVAVVVGGKKFERPWVKARPVRSLRRVKFKLERNF